MTWTDLFTLGAFAAAGAFLGVLGTCIVMAIIDWRNGRRKR